MYDDASQLIKGLSERDLEAYKTIFFQYHGRLVLFAAKFTGDIEIARDIVQDAFLTLWEKADHLSITKSPKAYLFQAVRNRSLNHIRHQTVKSSVTDKLMAEIRAAENAIYENYNDPFYSMLELEMEEKIDAVIEQLPEKCRQVFTLSRKMHLSNKEIAERMGISLKMVEKHISKALRVLRLQLVDYMSIIILILFNQ